MASGPLASVAVSQLDELTHRAVLSWLDYRRTRWLVGSSVVEDRQIELAEAVGVGDHVDLDGLPGRDREAETSSRPRGATAIPTAPFTSAGCANWVTHREGARLPCHGRRTANHHRLARSAVGHRRPLRTSRTCSRRCDGRHHDQPLPAALAERIHSGLRDNDVLPHGSGAHPDRADHLTTPHCQRDSATEDH